MLENVLATLDFSFGVNQLSTSSSTFGLTGIRKHVANFEIQENSGSSFFWIFLQSFCCVGDTVSSVSRGTLTDPWVTITCLFLHVARRPPARNIFSRRREKNLDLLIYREEGDQP